MKQNRAGAKKLQGNAQLMSCLWLFWGSFVFQSSTTTNKVISPGFRLKRVQWNYGISITPGHYCIPQSKGLSALSSVAMVQTTSDKTLEKSKFLPVDFWEKRLLQSGSKTSVHLSKGKEKRLLSFQILSDSFLSKKGLDIFKMMSSKIALLLLRSSTIAESADKYAR